jgi:FkbM family methyltransferase
MLLKTFRRVLSSVPLLYELAAAFKLAWVRVSYSGGGAIAAIQLVREEQGLALDIGANRGQSAIRILRLKPHFRVLSFEPNKRCISCLKIAKVLLGRSFQYELCGLSDINGNMIYYEPRINSLSVSAEGTFCPENLDDFLEQRIGRYDVRQTSFPVRVLDEMSLSPAFIKVDVQGAELAVLRGARDTITRCKPVVVVERNIHNEEGVKSYMADLGYKALSNGSANALGLKLGDLSGDNVFVFEAKSSSEDFSRAPISSV